MDFYGAIAAVIAFVVTAVLGKWMIPFLHRLKFGQTIREEGPAWHAKKQGTPTMGGLMFIIGSSLAVACCGGAYLLMSKAPAISFVRLLGGLLLSLGFGAIGFADDFISIKKKRNLGLTERQKLILQFLVVGAYLCSLYLAGERGETVIPFVGVVNLGVFYWILSLLIIVGMNNAVNFTDGIDGLNSMVTFFVCLALMLCAGILKMLEMSIFAAAIAGGCLGFLVWNFHPAKVFMGDTGSLFLGGAVCALAYGINMPILLLPVGLIYIAEILSVVLQVSYFKLTHGKRIFKMSPIHHHFELCGWSEVKICAIFSAVTVIGGGIAVLCVLFGA